MSAMADSRAHGQLQLARLLAGRREPRDERQARPLAQLAGERVRGLDTAPAQRDRARAGLQGDGDRAVAVQLHGLATEAPLAGGHPQSLARVLRLLRQEAL